MTTPAKIPFRNWLNRASLRRILIIPFVLQLAGAVGLVGYLSFRNGQETVQDLSSQLRRETSARIQQQLQSYVEIPHALNRINASALLNGNIDIEQGRGFYQLWEQAKLYPNTNLIYCGSEQDGSLVGVGRSQDTRLPQLVVYNAATGRLGYYYDLDSQGERRALQRKGKRKYDARVRPWYKAAKVSKQATWSEIYLDFDTQLPTITASLPVYSRDNSALLGVCATDFILPAEMSTFLKTLDVGKTGQTFIMKRSGVLVASSTDEQLVEGQGDQIEYRLATESQNPLVRGTAAYLHQRFPTLESITQAQQLDFQLDGQRQLVQLLPFNDKRGIDWIIVVVVPEADYMGQIDENTRLTGWLYLLSLGLALLVGMLTARWITRPISRLNAAAKQIAQGDWGQTVALKRQDELGELAQSFNQMAVQLQDSFIALEKRNSDLQQTKDDLAKANEQLEAVLNAVPGPISWIAADGFYLGINSYLAKSLNLPAESIVGNPISAVGNSPAYVAFVERFLQSPDRSASQEIPITIEGQERYYLLAAQKYQQGTAIVVVGVDITERRRAEAELHKAQA
ncbi:MAG: HAMP domain-containing protein, partial [Elainella sp.]